MVERSIKYLLVSEDTRDRLVMTALRLFAEKGYEATSVADVLKNADANSGSLYHFFPTKQALLLEVLRRYRDGIGPMLLQPAWNGVTDPIARVFALLAAYRRMLASTECVYGCPIGSLALELHEPDPPVRELIHENFEGWISAVEQCFREAAERLPKSTDFRALALFTLTTMEGGVMLARSARSAVPFDQAVAALRDYVDRLEREAKSGKTGIRRKQ